MCKISLPEVAKKKGGRPPTIEGGYFKNNDEERNDDKERLPVSYKRPKSKTPGKSDGNLGSFSK